MILQLFLQIYNEQITDLLDPNQRNLQVNKKISFWFQLFYIDKNMIFSNPVICHFFFQIREDVKSGVYVENLREEYVFTMKDVTQLLMKVLLFYFTCVIIYVVMYSGGAE